jgi:osmotically-inducible protein OsmY
MSVESSIREAIIDELKRQAENSSSRLKVEAIDELVTINGPVDLDDLVMVVVGSIAGGP